MKIKREELQAITALFLKKLEDSNIDEVELTEDFYWSVDSDKLYNPYKSPKKKNLTLGQLSHDWESLVELLEADKEPNSLQLRWLAEMFRYLGNKVVF